MSKKDELLKKIKKLEEEEKRRRDQIGDTDKPTKFQTGMLALDCLLRLGGLLRHQEVLLVRQCPRRGLVPSTGFACGEACEEALCLRRTTYTSD